LARDGGADPGARAGDDDDAGHVLSLAVRGRHLLAPTPRSLSPADQVRGGHGGRADLDQIIEMCIAGSGIGEHQLDKAHDYGEVVAQEVYSFGIKRDRSPSWWHICTQFWTSTIIRVQASRGCRRHT